MYNHKIEAAFHDATPRFHQSVCAALDKLTEKEVTAMKKQIILKRVLIAAAVMAVLSIGVFAASTVYSMTVSTSSALSYTQTPPSADKIKSDVGEAAIIPQSFENGFGYMGIRVGNAENRDEGGNVIDKYKTVMAEYSKSGETVMLNIVAEKHSQQDASIVKYTKEINGVTVSGSSYINKNIPVGYVKTEADKKAEAAGDVSFSLDGSADDEYSNEIKYISWTQNGVSYGLLMQNGTLSLDELADMAAEIINA